MLLGAVLGLFADTWGLRRCMLTGLALLAASSTVGPLVHLAGFMLLLRSLEGVGFLLVFMPGASLIRKLVSDQELPLMLGAWGICMPLATALSLMVGPLLLPLWDWPAWWWLTAAFSVLAAWALAWMVPGDDSRAKPLTAAPPGLGRGPVGRALAMLRATLSSPGPWLVASTFAFYSSQWQAVMGFLPSIYGSAALGVGVTATLSAVVAGANMLGNLSAGALLQRGAAPAWVLRLGFLAMALGAGLAFQDFWPLAAWGRYLALVAFSALGGLIPGTLFSLAVRLAPTEGAISTTVGWMAQCSALGQFIGPPVVAWVAARSGGWQWTWVVTGGCCLMGLALSQRIDRRLASN
jgi:MFS family permease